MHAPQSLGVQSGRGKRPWLAALLPILWTPRGGRGRDGGQGGAGRHVERGELQGAEEGGVQVQGALVDGVDEKVRLGDDEVEQGSVDGALEDGGLHDGKVVKG